MRKNDIEQIIGVELPKYEEFTQKIIFIKDAKVIYTENSDVDIEGVKNGELILDMQNNFAYLIYDSKVEFEIDKRQLNWKQYYTIKEVGNRKSIVVTDKPKLYKYNPQWKSETGVLKRRNSIHGSS